MKSDRLVAWGVVAALLIWAAPAGAGWVIDEVVRGAGEGSRQQFLLQANQMKTVMTGPNGQRVSGFILDLNAQTITQIDYEERHYITFTMQEFAEMMQGVQQMTSGLMAEVMKEMEAGMKDMPPEERKMMEQMMGGQMPKLESKPGECRESRIEYRRTGQQATIAGYQAVRYDVLVDGKAESELWLAKGLDAWRELDPKKLEQFTAEMAKLIPCGKMQGAGGFRSDDPAWKLVGEGFPVRTVERPAGFTVEVVRAESRSIPEGEFQPPAGFARKTLKDMMKTEE